MHQGATEVCSSVMTRRTSLQVDDARLSQVQEILGTSGLKDTVERAFDEVVRAHLRRRLAERLSTGEGLDISDPDVYAAVSRWRT